MRPHFRCPRRAVAVAVIGSIGVVLAGCTRSNDLSARGVTAPTTTDATAPVAAPSTTEGPNAGTTAVSPPTTDAPSSESTTGTSPVSLVELAEVGVPGLDSSDAFCAAWSRFAGSFQVVAVTAAFGSGSGAQLAALEVAASPVVTTSYDDLLANWPDELSSEADVVADEFLGPFARRLSTANEALVEAGASDTAIATIADAWVAGLSRRDPTTPEFTVDLDDETWSVIDEAAALFSSRLVPFGSDPSLVTDVRTPLTDEYLAVSCPDQGTLSGQEVDSG